MYSISSFPLIFFSASNDGFSLARKENVCTLVRLRIFSTSMNKVLRIYVLSTGLFGFGIATTNFYHGIKYTKKQTERDPYGSVSQVVTAITMSLAVTLCSLTKGTIYAAGGPVAGWTIWKRYRLYKETGDREWIRVPFELNMLSDRRETYERPFSGFPWK